MPRTLCCCLWAASLFAADDALVVEVNGDAIRVGEVARAYDAAVKGRTLTPGAEAALKQGLVARLVDERLVLANLSRQGRAVKPAEVDLALQRLEARLTPGGFATLLKDRRMTRDDLAAEYSRRMTWQRYLDEKTTDENLQKFFEKYRREFDGTELRVSHVLLRIEGTQDQGTLAAALQKAQALREEIVNGRMIFSDAAARFSAGPSRENGGDLGFIPRRDRMVEEFSAAAFRLKVGEISPPTVTVFGVHLIKVTEEKPGTIIWQDVREQLVNAAQVPLFRQIAAHLRKAAEVEYTGLVPRIDPSTGKLVPGS